MKGGDERQAGNAKVMEDESGGREGGRRSARKVGMKGCEENAMPGIENERGSEESVAREEERRRRILKGRQCEL